MKYKYILFDLDGTLTDSGPGIMNCVKYALEALNSEIIDYETIRSFIGPPLYESYLKIFNGDEVKATQAVEKYRERYRDIGIYENEMYPGISELLDKLKSGGFILSLATSKPDVFARRILDYFDISRYFDYISAAGMSNGSGDKGDIIRNALDMLDCKDLENIIMTGDRLHDIIGAKKNNICSIGAAYGYGSVEELSEAGAEYIVRSVGEIYDIVK